jgi:hypothetical protein
MKLFQRLTMQEDRKKKGSPVAVYREMIFGDTCEELELSSIGEIIGITKAADLVDPDEGKLDISIETRVPPAHIIGKSRKALRIQVFLVIRSLFYSSNSISLL